MPAGPNAHATDRAVSNASRRTLPPPAPRPLRPALRPPAPSQAAIPSLCAASCHGPCALCRPGRSSVLELAEEGAERPRASRARRAGRGRVLGKGGPRASSPLRRRRRGWAACAEETTARAEARERREEREEPGCRLRWSGASEGGSAVTAQWTRRGECAPRAIHRRQHTWPPRV